MNNIEQIKKEAKEKLNAKIMLAELENDFETKTGFKLNAFDTFSIIDLTKLDLNKIKPALLKIMKQYKPNKKIKGIEGAAKKWDHKSWMRLDVLSVINNEQKASLIYYNNELKKVWIDIPLNYYSDFLADEPRKVYDSEKHYFTGYSEKRLRELKIPRKTIRGIFDIINWYGGNTTLWCKDKEWVKHYNSFLLTGEI